MNLNDVPYVVAVASGKGGVGKTTVATDMARVADDQGYTVGVIDADISTPNSPEVLGGEDIDLSGERLSSHDAIIPPAPSGIQIVSQGVVLPDDIPVLRDGKWRAEAVVDYVDGVDWDEDTDLVVVDTPPGTGEELQVIASEAPLTRAFVVTTPHPSSIRDAKKTHEFFKQAGVDHGTILNMAYIPSGDIVSHISSEADFRDIKGVGDATAEEIMREIGESTPDLPLFDYDDRQGVPIDAPHATTVPYTPDYSARATMYKSVVRSILGESEVEA